MRAARAVQDHVAWSDLELKPIQGHPSHSRQDDIELLVIAPMGMNADVCSRAEDREVDESDGSPSSLQRAREGDFSLSAVGEDAIERAPIEAEMLSRRTSFLRAVHESPRA